MEVALGVVVVLAFFALIALGASVRVLREYERGVIFRLGRLIAQKGPGLILLIPFIDRMVKVDLRTVTLNIPPQEVITRDNVPCRVNAVAYFRVIDPNRAIVEVENYLLATSQISQTALRSVLGKAELDQLLSERERLNEELQKIIDESTEPWGVKVTAVEIKDVEIPEQMQRAMARQAEAERERRAKIINSEGEFQAAQKLTDAADIISTNPASLQLRYLQTLLEIGSNQNTTVVFPLPMDVLEPFIGRGDGRRRRGAERRRAPPPHRRRRRPTSPTSGDLPPSAVLSAELARDPHRPADRAADDPRPGPGRAARRASPAPSERAEGPGELPLLRGARGPHAAGGLRAAPGRRRGRTPPAGRRGWCRTSTRRWAAGGASAGDDGRRPAAEAGAFASGGDPLLASRAGGRTRPLLLAAGDRRPRGDRSTRPQHVTAMAELDEEQFAAAVATWRERMRAHADAAYVQLIVNEGGGAGASLEHTHAQLYALPFVPAAVARERERAGAYGERTAGGGLLSDILVEEVRRERAPGRDRRGGGADLPLGLALALRAAGGPAREPRRASSEDDGWRGDDPHRAARCSPSASTARRSSTSGSAPRRAAPSTSTGTSTSPRG